MTINDPLEFHNLSRKPKKLEPWFYYINIIKGIVRHVGSYSLQGQLIVSSVVYVSMIWIIIVLGQGSVWAREICFNSSYSY